MSITETTFDKAGAGDSTSAQAAIREYRQFSRQCAVNPPFDGRAR